MNRLLSRLWCAGLAVTLVAAPLGCRAISRFGESRQSIAARRLSRLGLQAMHDGHRDTAEALFVEALDVSESDDRAHAGLAESLWMRGDREQAVGHMERAVRLSGGDPKYVLRLGRMYLESGRLEEANRQCRVALQAERNSADGWTLRGDCLRAAGDSDQALAAYHRALALRPDSPDAQLQAAEIYREQKRYDRLLATLDRMQEGVGIDQAPPRSDLLRGIALRQLGRTADARRCFARAASKAPRDPQPHLQLAELAAAEGNLAQAQSYLLKAREVAPEAVEGLALASGSAGELMRFAPPQLAEQDRADTPVSTPLRR